MEISQIGLPKWDPDAFCKFLRIAKYLLLQISVHDYITKHSFGKYANAKSG